MKTNGPSKKFQTKPCKEGSIELDKKNVSLKKNSKFQKNVSDKTKKIFKYTLSLIPGRETRKVCL